MRRGCISRPGASPRPQRQHASPLRLRDDCGGDREVTQKGKNVKGKPKYIIVRDGEPIMVSDHFPQELAEGPYVNYMWVIRLSDLKHWYLGEWMDLQEYEQQTKMF
jgi:hypothetical protein